MASKQPSLVYLAILCSLPVNTWDFIDISCSTHAQIFHAAHMLSQFAAELHVKLAAVKHTIPARKMLMCRLAPPADAAFYAHFSHRPEDGAGAAAVQLAAPRLLWQLAQPRAAGSMPSDLISSRPGLSTAAADGAAPAQPVKRRPGGSVNRGDRGTERPDMQQ